MSTEVESRLFDPLESGILCGILSAVIFKICKVHALFLWMCTFTKNASTIIKSVFSNKKMFKLLQKMNSLVHKLHNYTFTWTACIFTTTKTYKKCVYFLYKKCEHYYKKGVFFNKKMFKLLQKMHSLVYKLHNYTFTWTACIFTTTKTYKKCVYFLYKKCVYCFLTMLTKS